MSSGERPASKLFVSRGGQKSYREYNFSPSGDWAAYEFAGYREGMARRDVDAPPYIRDRR